MPIVASSLRAPYVTAALLLAGAGQVRGILPRSVSPGRHVWLAHEAGTPWPALARW
jgi:hypothetical protein